MGIWKDKLIDEMELDSFVDAVRHYEWDNTAVARATVLEEETTRTMRNKKGQFERVYGELYMYDDGRNVFVPTSHSFKHIVEAAAPIVIDQDPVGYHNLRPEDL